jgi:type II secretory pathway pseudopilin PulG
VELLVVISIMAIMAVIAIPNFMGLTSSGRMNQNLTELSGLLEQARQYSLAQNTYVWVAFLPATDATGTKTLSVAVLASKDGTDPASPASWANNSYGVVPSAQIGLVSKIITLRQIALLPAATLTSARISGLPVAPTPINGVASSSGFFSLQVPGTSAPQAFTQALEFTPSGEARNGLNPVDLVELDLQPQKGNAALDQQNVAVIRVNGLTGESVIYRP